MQRQELEHIIRASSAITGATEIVVIGSQSVLGQFPHAPAALLISEEADVFTFRNPLDADLIEGSIGEGSPFHQTFGYYAHGVAETTATLPEGWRNRLVKVRNENTGTGEGLCLEVHDLAVAKLAAGREKDETFLSDLIQHQLVSIPILETRLQQTPLAGDHLALVKARLKRLSQSARE